MTKIKTYRAPKVNWNEAPELAQFYSAGCFRYHDKHVNNEYWWNVWCNRWDDAVYESLDEHMRYADFEMRPTLDDSNCNTYNPDDTPDYDESLDDKWDSGELGQSEDNVVVSKPEFAAKASEALKELVGRKKESTPIKSEWTATHYDNYYHLTDADIKSGKIRVDAYFVNKMWKLNEKDDTGVLFHSLKTIARFGDKNPIERELKALYAQTKRMAELYGVDLEC